VAVMIRLKRLGRRNRPHWRICATDKRAARDGRVIEELGHYDPHKGNEDKVSIHRDRILHWLHEGARPSKTVKELLGHLGIGPTGDEIPPRPWPTKKAKQAPPPKAAERLAEEKAQAEADQAAEADAADTPEADTPPAESADAEADAGDEANA